MQSIAAAQLIARQFEDLQRREPVRRPRRRRARARGWLGRRLIATGTRLVGVTEARRVVVSARRLAGSP